MKEININIDVKKWWTNIKKWSATLKEWLEIKIEDVGDFITDDHSRTGYFLMYMIMGIATLLFLLGIITICFMFPVIPITLLIIFVIFLVGVLVSQLFDDIFN